MSRVACRTLLAYLRAALGECDADPGAIVCLQSFGALVHWHPHLHVLMTDGAFRRDGTFRPTPPHDPAVLEAAWRRGAGDVGARRLTALHRSRSKSPPRYKK